MAYNRNKAFEYANKHWNLVCHDGAVAVTDETNNVKKTNLIFFPPGTDITKENINNENDCSHFVSCCIGTHGGGFPIGAWEFGRAYGILSAPNLAVKLKTSGKVSLLGEHIDRSMVADKLSGMEIGDVIGYADNANSFHHMVLYTGNGNISCHTSSRWNKPWTDVSFNKITLFHFNF